MATEADKAVVDGKAAADATPSEEHRVKAESQKGLSRTSNIGLVSAGSLQPVSFNKDTLRLAGHSSLPRLEGISSWNVSLSFNPL